MKSFQQHLATLLCLFFLAACQPKETKDMTVENEPMEAQNADQMEPDSVFIHTVFFYFNEGVTEEERAKFEQELDKLAKCETIYKVWYGKAAGTDREVVDNSYDYAWIVHFKNAADQDVYQHDPIHLAFIEACSSYWNRVQVYDSVVKKG